MEKVLRRAVRIENQERSEGTRGIRRRLEEAALANGGHDEEGKQLKHQERLKGYSKLELAVHVSVLN